MVGYDGSDCAREALRVALEVAASRGCGVVAAFFAEPPAALAGTTATAPAELIERGRQLLEPLQALGAEHGVDLETLVIDDKPAPGLIALADQRDAAMIVLGTYSERPLAAALVGSTPHKLLHLSSRPVLVVPVRSS